MTISCGSLAEELHILHLPTASTLMLEALSSGQPRVVRNTAKFLEVRTQDATWLQKQAHKRLRAVTVVVRARLCRDVRVLSLVIVSVGHV
jgi:hypothetical protein